MRLEILLLILLGTYTATAQNMISMTTVHPVADTVGAGKKELAIRYPALRLFNVVANGYREGDFDAKDDKVLFAKGKIKTFRTSAFVNTPALQWGGNSLSATVFYTYTSIELKDIINYLPSPQVNALKSDKSTFDLAVNYSRAGHIFNHPIIYSLIANAISNDVGSVRRFNFNGSFSVPLIREKNTSFSVGALVLIDPSAPSPVLPVINYYHRFMTSDIELIVDLPSGINVKKRVIRNGWIMLGSNQNSYSLFYHNKESFNTIEARSGLAIEYLFAQKIIVGLGGGINSTLSSKVFRHGEDYHEANLSSKNQSVPYVNLSLSLLPF